MIMMGLEYRGEIPFSDVYITSIIQAPDGRRMSKSLGTGIDPLELIDRHGADATRFGLLAMSSSQDVRFSEEKIAQGGQLANKLWNASRLVLLATQPGDEPAPRPQTVEDRWILSRLQRAKASMRRSIETLEFHHAALGLYDYVFTDLCDRYLELVKRRLDDADTRATLLHLLSETVALAHPLIPFVSEEIWGHLPGGEGELAEARFPADAPELVDAAAEAAIERQFAAVQAVRAWRDAVGVPPGPRLPARLEAEGYDQLAAGIAQLARLEWSDDAGEAVASVPIPGGAVAILASDAVDLEADARRREQQRETLLSEIARAEGKLGNERFVAKAPAAVVRQEREKLERLRAELADLEP
jgi:valyl-tRNA synthetase